MKPDLTISQAWNGGRRKLIPLFFHKRDCFFLIVLLLTINPIWSQNLLPDGSFEKVLSNECVRPDQGFKKMQYWYLLDATPDLFEGGCTFNEKDFVFWDESVDPFDGNNYAGIWSRWNSNENYFTEGIATSFTRPLEAGKTYLFEMAIRNQGTYQGVLGGTQVDCTLEPEKHIDLYISTDSIKVENDFANGTASTSAPLVAVLDSKDVQGESTDGWTKISTCFQAQGGERFFAIIMPLGTFGDLPACAKEEFADGVYQSFYYNIDAASVVEWNESGFREITACSDQLYEVDLLDVFDFDLFDETTFIWEDGIEDAQRQLTQTGIYAIDALVDCGSIPLVLEVLPQSCESDLFVPNVFSPNSDGLNDLFQPYFASRQNVRNFQMRIMDRWGNLLFYSKDPDTGWDGTNRNQKVPQGMYAWFISFDLMELEKETRKIKSGEVLILR